MAVAQSDIKTYLTGANSDGGAQTNKNLSLGKYRSSTEVATRTTLNGAHNDSVTTITVASTTGFNSGGYIRVDNEIIQYTGTTATTFTGCTRAALSTTATSHVNGAVVEVVGWRLFDHVMGGELTAGDTEYRCYCVKNTHATDSAQTMKIYLSLDEANAQQDISFAVEVPTGSDTAGYAQGPLANEGTAPTVGSGNVSAWSDATTYATGVGVNQGSHDANLDAGEIVFVWIRRTVNASSSAATNDRVIIATAFDTQ